MTLVLLSSNAQPRYADDIVRILALPKGGQMQFRYDVRLLSPGVLAWTRQCQWQERAALVCYLTPGSSTTDREMIPVRLVRVTRAETIGSSCVFTLEADAFVAGLDNVAIHAGVPDEGPTSLPVIPSSDPTGEGHYAFGAALPPERFRKQEWDSFEATATALANHPPFDADGLFYTVRRLALADRGWFGRWPAGAEAKAGTFRLRSGRRYELQVYCFSPEKVPAGTKLVAEAEDDFISFVSAPMLEIDSRYDLKRIFFSTEANVLPRAAGIRLYLARKDGELEIELSRDSSLQFSFAGTWLLGVGRAVAVGVGTAGPAMVAANAADKLTVGVAIVMLALGTVAGLGSVFLSLRKP